MHYKYEGQFETQNSTQQHIHQHIKHSKKRLKIIHKIQNANSAIFPACKQSTTCKDVLTFVFKSKMNLLDGKDKQKK